jgi:murein DD-endopeptidase MepM/ murein hydrolase activator NlpD
VRPVSPRRGWKAAWGALFSLALLLLTGGLVTASNPTGGGMGVSSGGYVTTRFVEPINYQTSGAYYDANNQLRSANYTFHHGVDISGGCVAGVYPVYAAASGTVAFAQYINDGYGSQVAIDHGFNIGSNGKHTYTFYAHMGNRSNGQRYIFVSPGQRVSAGDLIGYQGNDGSTFGSCGPDAGTHVDWEIRLSSSPLAYNTQMRYGGVAASQNFYTYLQLSYGDPNPVARVTPGPFGGQSTPTNTPTPPAPPTYTPTRPPSPTPGPTFTPGPCGMRFHDLPDSHWAYSHVLYLYCRGAVGGYADGTFRPGNPLTRGQFSKMVVVGHAWQPYNPFYPTFTDLPRDHTFYPHVETLRFREIIGGYADGTFRPNNHMTRAQATKMVVLSRGWAILNPPNPSFTDVPRAHWGYRYIETAWSRGIVERRGDGTFGPEEEITRAELSRVLALGLQLSLRPGDPGPKAGP